MNLIRLPTPLDDGTPARRVADVRRNSRAEPREPAGVGGTLQSAGDG